MELTPEDFARARREPILHATEVTLGLLDDAAGATVVLIGRHVDTRGRTRVRMIRFDEQSLGQLREQLDVAMAVLFP